jgi:hypothetical protein
MKGMSRSALALALSFLVLPAVALADGPPVGGWAEGGVTTGSLRYVALPAGRGTLLERLNTNGAQPLRTRYLKSPRGIPMVATDGTPGGLSQDGRTLVLTAPRTSYPQVTSTLYLMNPQTLSLRRRITLKGDFSFDAISPDGATLYLIQLNARDFTRYAVRALHTATGRLFPKPVVDAREPDEVMRGYPVTRVTSPDGRFAYTLYVGGEKPFVHALDTTRRTAACIDLPPLSDSAQMTLHLKGRRLAVQADGTPVADVDTATRKMWQPAAKARAPSPTGGNGGGNLPVWLVLAGVGAAGLAGAATLGARRRRAGAARP